VTKGPSLDPQAKHLAMQTEDHPFDYGSFEGVIPAGQYGAGEVIVWDCGVYSPDEGGDTWFHDRGEGERQVREGIAKGKLSIELRGEKVKGSFALVRTKEAKSWLLLKHRDRFATGEDLAPRDRSVLSEVSVGEMASMPAHRIAAERLVAHGRPEAMPAKLEPMHAEVGERPFTDAAWSWEPKLDGYRVLAFIEATGVRLRSRRGVELSGELTHGAESTRNRNRNRSALRGQPCPFSGGGLQAASESSVFIDCGLSILYLLVSSMKVQRSLKQVASV